MFTSQFTVNATGDPEPVTAFTDCRSISIFQDTADATQLAYKVRAPFLTSQTVQRHAGTQHFFTRADGQAGFRKGDIVGYVETVSSSATFHQVEQ